MLSQHLQKLLLIAGCLNSLKNGFRDRLVFHFKNVFLTNPVMMEIHIFKMGNTGCLHDRSVYVFKKINETFCAGHRLHTHKKVCISYLHSF